MQRLFIAIGFLLGFAARALAACATSVPTGSITVVDCTAESLVTNSPSYALTDATALALDFYLGWSNAATSLLSGVPVSGTLTFTNGNPVINWPNHGMAANSYIVLTTTLPNQSTVGTVPSNFTASTFASQTVYYVIATGLTANGFELSASAGGAAITPNASGTAYAFDLVPAFAAASNAAINGWVQGQKTAATAAPSPPAQLPITAAQ